MGVGATKKRITTNMLKVGITGGIGSGKTTVCRIFEQQWGIPVYYADDRAKWLMQNDTDLMEALREAFGREIYTGSGLLNRVLLAEMVFSDVEKLQQLNALVHPVVQRDNEEWQRAQKYKNAPYTLKEAALLYESGSHALLDKIIVVAAPLEVRIERVMQRDGVARQAVLARISKQMPQEEKERLADFIVQNASGERTLLLQEVQKTHEKLLKLAERGA